MYELPSNDKISKVVIDENVILGKSEPILVYETEQNRAVAES
jgi:ATP-dependent Clp protease ATP-binding subunit ClpX